VTLDGLLTFLTLIIAAYAIIPSVARLRLCLHIVPPLTRKLTIQALRDRLLELNPANLPMYKRLTAALATFREGSPQRTAAYINLRNIRSVRLSRSSTFSTTKNLTAENYSTEN
jgi:hypothetical protein